MRTTLEIDDDVLQAAKDLAAARKVTAGRVISDLARQALQPERRSGEFRNGVPTLLPSPGERSVSLETVNRLRDDELTNEQKP